MKHIDKSAIVQTKKVAKLKPTLKQVYEYVSKTYKNDVVYDVPGKVIVNMMVDRTHVKLTIRKNLDISLTLSKDLTLECFLAACNFEADVKSHFALTTNR